MTRHANSVLFVAFAVYAYRDLWPLATFNLQPADLADGPVLWAKIALLTFTAVVIPLFIPRQYVPVDPKVCFEYCVAFQLLSVSVESDARSQPRANRVYFLLDGLHVLGFDCPGGCQSSSSVPHPTTAPLRL